LINNGKIMSWKFEWLMKAERELIAEGPLWDGKRR